MTISRKQLEANRANAQKTTGPRTNEGKYMASRNANPKKSGDAQDAQKNAKRGNKREKTLPNPKAKTIAEQNDRAKFRAK